MELLIPKNALTVTLYKALDEIDEGWRNLPGLICTGSWPGQDDATFIKSIIPKIKEAKDSNLPYLGLCLGMQAMAIMEGGELEEMRKVRTGIFPVEGWWGKTQESHWHKYRVLGDFPDYEIYGEEIIEVMRHKTHSFFVGTQFHGEYQSSKYKPHPILLEFINTCKICQKE